MQVKISEEVKRLVPSCALGVIRYKALLEKSGEELLLYFDSKMEEIGSKYVTKDIADMPHIKRSEKILTHTEALQSRCCVVLSLKKVYITLIMRLT